MPGMSGREVLQRLLAISPSVRVVSFSGLDQPMPGARAHLGKPVPIDRLLATLRTVLDEPG
jgi:DNA-binding NarL/FixJ family response regulator